ncbi:unnamed protein product [Rotaria magnacalcarata]|uniref:Craniofacial development protein 2-like n=1 Tax=Rotaria magnacalcarata TaxID=392030 RepID=A0A8S2Z351_9BILA|nr:unnamed protein product [Rotaria magnacalcarata]
MNNENEQTKLVTTTRVTLFGSWNVRSCYRVTKRELIDRQLKRYRIQVAALAETKIQDSGVCVVNGYTFIYSGTPSQQLSKSAHGAACRPVPITIIAVYAPINPSNGVKNDIETCDEFYKTLQAAIDKTHKSDMIMIMSDFNARVGVEQANTAG